jgi:hypothetical protein
MLAAAGYEPDVAGAVIDRTIRHELGSRDKQGQDLELRYGEIEIRTLPEGATGSAVQHERAAVEAFIHLRGRLLRGFDNPQDALGKDRQASGLVDEVQSALIQGLAFQCRRGTAGEEYDRKPDSWSRSRLSRSMPFIAGMFQSRTMASAKVPLVIDASSFQPSAKLVTEKPRSSSSASAASRKSESSSTNMRRTASSALTDVEVTSVRACALPPNTSSISSLSTHIAESSVRLRKAPPPVVE